MHVHLARTLGAFEPSDKIDHQDETAALEVAHVTLGPKSQRIVTLSTTWVRHQRVKWFCKFASRGLSEVHTTVFET